jgi:hypothetical protein
MKEQTDYFGKPIHVGDSVLVLCVTQFRAHLIKSTVKSLTPQRVRIHDDEDKFGPACYMSKNIINIKYLTENSLLC